ncbi:MAG: transporter substrate-binding domain-containing protein [Oligoflexia bacterium]|nr:transporter substrate-binding domain-containing protein [Oligoflexia bacterium]
MIYNENMNRRLWRTTTLILMMTLVAIVSAADRQVINLTNGEWPPLLSEKAPNYGALSEIVTRAFALENIDVHYGFYPWIRGLDLARTGEWDGTLAWSITDDRARDFYISKEPIYTTVSVFFHRKSLTVNEESLSELKKYRIGLSRGYHYGGGLDEMAANKQLNIEYAKDDLLNFKKLLAGRVDLVPIEVKVGLAIIKQHLTEKEQAQIVYATSPVIANSIYLLLSKKVSRNKQLMERFDRGLKQLIDNGEYQEYLLPGAAFTGITGSSSKP